MSGFFSLRARRFHALHDLLTERLRDHPQPFPLFLAGDVGLPTVGPKNHVVGALGTLIRVAGR